MRTHVGNVLTKLGVRDRVQAVLYVYESGLVTAPVAVYPMVKEKLSEEEAD